MGGGPQRSSLEEEKVPDGDLNQNVQSEQNKRILELEKQLANEKRDHGKCKVENDKLREKLGETEDRVKAIKRNFSEMENSHKQEKRERDKKVKVSVLQCDVRRTYYFNNQDQVYHSKPFAIMKNGPNKG